MPGSAAISEKSSEGQYAHSDSPDSQKHPDSNSLKIQRVLTSGGQGEYVHLGDKTYLKSELMYAFGGTFNPGVAPAPRLKLGNGTPLGLFAFATTTLLLSFVNAKSRGLTNSNIMLGLSLFYGGIMQGVAGLWELVVENTFGATVFATYGGFWLSYAVITMDGFNIASSYKSDKDFSNAMGLYMLCWALVTFFFMLCVLRSTVAMFSLLLTLFITFVLLSGSQFTAANGNATTSGHLAIAGGVFGCVTAMCGYYNALAGLLTKESSWFTLSPLYMPGAIRPDDLKAKEA